MSLSPDERENTPEPRISEVCLNLDNQFLSMQELSKAEGMRVYARVRPMLNSETEAGFKECIAAIDDQTVRAVVPSTSAKYRSTSQGTQDIIEDFTFTSAFGAETGQFVFFEECMMNTMLNFIEGQNSLVFSYGSTGSGKTFTLQGNPENPGIMPLSLHLFFATLEDQLLKKAVVKPDKFADIIVLSENDRKKEMQLKEQLLSISEQEEWSSKNSSNSFAMVLCDTFSEKSEIPERQTTLGPEEMAQAQAATLMKELSKRSAEQQSGVCNIWVSFVEIYNENVYDLFQPNIAQRNKLNLGEDKNGDVYVKGLQEVCVSNCYEALKLLTLGQKNLKIASTKLNYQSSRSHCIFTMKVIRIPDPENITYAKVNRLSFCDLAGSERAAKSQTTGMRLKEAGCINTSLLVLGRCLEQLRSNPNLRDKKLIPFRESKLTRLFSGFFTGKGKAMMVINASPSELTFDETLHVLRFSAIAKELIINDSYITTASNTLQTITNMWTNARANRSNNSSDKSISFEDSMEELQEKDELIEKLLDLAESLRNNLEKEKKEKAELEIKIRQEVYQDYSKYSDELLENQKRAYEEECEAIKEIHNKRISSMEKMYDNIIKDYKTQLEESESSEDETYDVSKVGDNDKKESIVELSEISPKKTLDDLVKVEISECVADSEKDSNYLEIEIEALKKDLWDITEELRATKEELQKVTDHATSLESVTIELEKKLEIAMQDALNENDELKKRNDYLQTSYQEEIMKLQNKKESVVLLNENEIKDLKVKYVAAQLELKSTLDKSEEMLKEYEALKIDCVFYETDNKDLQKAKSVLDEKVQSLLNELATVKNEKQSIQEKCVEFENKTASHNNEVQKLNAIIDELNELRNKSQAEYEKALHEAEKKFLDANNNLNVAYLELEEEKNKSGALETDISFLQQNVIDLQNKNQNDVETISTILKELDDARLENTKLNEKLAEAENSIISLNKSISDLKGELGELLKRHLETEEILKSSQTEAAEAADVLEVANQALNCATVMTEERDTKIVSLEVECDSLKIKLADFEEKYATATNDFAKLMILKEDLEKKYATSNEKCAELLTVKEDLEKNYTKANEKCAELITVKDDLEKKYATANEKCAELMTVKDALEKKYATANEKCAELMTVKDNLEKKCAIANDKCADLICIKEELESKYANSNEECADLTRIKEDLEEKHTISTNELVDLMRMKEKAEQKFAFAMKQLEIKKSTETPEEAKTSEALQTVGEQAEDIRSLISECMQLKEEVSALQETNLDLNNKLSSAHESLNLEQTAFNRRIEEFEKTVAELKENTVKSEQEMSYLKNIEQEKEQLRENIEKELKEATEKLESTSKELKDALESIQKKSEEMNALKTNNDEFKNYVMELKEAEIKLKEQINNLTENLDSKEVSHKLELDALNATLEKELNMICEKEKAIEVIQNDFNYQKNEIALLTQQKLTLKEKLNSQPQIDMNGDLHKQELDSLNARLDVALNTIENQEKELVILQNNCVAHKEEISQLELLKKDLEEKLSSPQLDALTLKLIQVLQDCEKKATIKIENLEERAQLDKCCINECEKECEELHSVVDILQNIEQLATKRIKNLHSASISHVEQITDLKRTIAGKESSIESLKNDYTALQKQLKDFQVSSKKQLQTEKQQLTSEIEDMRKLKKDLEKENKELKSKTTQLHTQKQQLMAETEDVKKLKKDVEKENKELKSKLTQLEDEKENLSKEAETLKNLQNMLSKRKSSTSQIEKKDSFAEIENLDISPIRISKRKSSTPQIEKKDSFAEIENLDISPTRTSKRKSSSPQKSDDKTKEEVIEKVEDVKKSENKSKNVNSEEKRGKEKTKLKSSTNKTEKKQNKWSSKKADNIEENQKHKENANQTHALRKQKRNFREKADNIEENQKQKENVNQTKKQHISLSKKTDKENLKQMENSNQETKENGNENALKGKKVIRRQLRNLENVPVDLKNVPELSLKDLKPLKTKSIKRKMKDDSSEDKSPINKLLKKIKLNDIENISNPKPQSLRIQVLTGKIVKNETFQPSPRLTRGRKKLFNSELFQSKENVAENKSRRAVRW